MNASARLTNASGLSTVGIARLLADLRGCSSVRLAARTMSRATSSWRTEAATECRSCRILRSDCMRARRSACVMSAGEIGMPLSVMRSARVDDLARLPRRFVAETASATSGSVEATSFRAASWSLAPRMYDAARLAKSAYVERFVSEARRRERERDRDEREGGTGDVLDLGRLEPVLDDGLDGKVGHVRLALDGRVGLPPQRELDARPRARGERVQALEERGEALVGRGGVQDDERERLVEVGGKEVVEVERRGRVAASRCTEHVSSCAREREGTSERDAPVDADRALLDSLLAPERDPELVHGAHLLAADVGPALALALGRLGLRDVALALLPHVAHGLERRVAVLRDEREVHVAVPAAHALLPLVDARQGRLERHERLVGEGVARKDRVVVAVLALALLAVEPGGRLGKDRVGEGRARRAHAVLGEGVEEGEEGVGALGVDPLAAGVRARQSLPRNTHDRTEGTHR